jgi:RNA polymerase sigma-70 factor (ECF subfamily)
MRSLDVEDGSWGGIVAFYSIVHTRLAIDRLRRAKARRESYVGPWLPEPVLTGRDVADDVVF